MTSDSDMEGMLQRKNDLDEGGRKVHIMCVCIMLYIRAYTQVHNIHHLYLTKLFIRIHVSVLISTYIYDCHFIY